MMKINNDGSLLNQHRYAPYKYKESDRYSYSIEMKSILITPDQGLVLGGSAGNSNTHWDIWLAKTDSEGIVDTSCGRSEIATDTNITIEDINGTSPTFTLTNINQHSIQVSAIAALEIKDATGTAEFLCYDIAGSVVDVSGNPVASAKVTATGIDVEDSGNATSNLEGKFRITSLNLGNYRVEATKSGMQFQAQEVTVPTNGVVFAPGLSTYSISGRVIYYGDSKFEKAQNKGIDKATVTAIKLNNNARIEVQTDDQGVYSISGLEPGTYRIEAKKGQRILFIAPYDSIEISSDRTDIDFQGHPDFPGYILPYVNSDGDVQVTRTGEQYKWLYDLFGLVTRSSSFHDSTDGRSDQRGAIDWALSEGAPVLAARGGKVVGVMTNAESYGCPIIIDHQDDTYGKYMHISQYRVQVGDYVEAGERIGNVGNRCGSIGAHIHLEIETTQDETVQTEVGMIFTDESARQTDGLMIPFSDTDKRTWTYRSDSSDRCPHCVVGHVYRGSEPVNGVKLYVKDKQLPTDNLVRLYYHHSGPDGSYEISIPSSDRQDALTIIPQSGTWQFDPPSATVSVSENSAQMDFSVVTTPVKGHVQNLSGQPIANATITAYNRAIQGASPITTVIVSETVTSDVNGYYELHNLPKNDVYRIDILVNSDLVGSREIALDAERTEDFVVVPTPKSQSIYLSLIHR